MKKKKLMVNDLVFDYSTCKEHGPWLEMAFDDGTDARDIIGIKNITKLRDFLTTIINKEDKK